MTIGKFLLLVCALLVPVTLSGCTGNANQTNTAQTGDHDHDHDHSHEHGPHGGHLIELGGEKYHLEWDHDDDAHKLTFYVLDADAENEVPTAAESLQINLKVGEGEGEQRSFEVPAVRQEGAETTALFETDDADLFALVTDEEVEATVVIEIEGTVYEGEIEHHAH